MEAQTASSVGGQSMLGSESTRLRLMTSGTSIREIRESIPKSPVVSNKSNTIQPKPKRKSMFLGNLFQKEPSMVALEQFSTNMQAQRGSTTARTVPYVSSQKMPQHVPKVNSKWDGVPDAIKDKEKTRARSKRTSVFMTPMNGLRIGGGDIPFAVRRRSSVAESWDSRSSGSKPEFDDRPHRRPDSMYSCSSGEIVLGQHLGQSDSRPVWIDFGSNPSDASSNASAGMNPTCFTVDNEIGHVTSSTPIEPIPEQSVSPFPSPIECSPQTPGPLEDSTWSSYQRAIPTNAFLAGEARPLALTAESSPTCAKSHSSMSTTQRDERFPMAFRFPQRLGKRAQSLQSRTGSISAI